MSGLPERMRAAMLHGLSDAVVTVDKAGNVKGFNRHAEQLLRIKEKEALGRALGEVLGLRPAHNSALLDAWIGETASADVVVQCGDGAPAMLHATAARASDGALVIVLRDQQATPPTAGPREIAELPPRLADTLRALLEGLSEKQIAGRLEISQHTVHDYVKALYKRFSVQSRGELLALFVAESKKRA